MVDSLNSSNEKIKANIKIYVDDDKFRESLVRALIPDTLTVETNRVKVNLIEDKTEKAITLIFEAKDLVGFRAIVNSFLRLIYTIEECFKLISGSSKK